MSTPEKKIPPLIPNVMDRLYEPIENPFVELFKKGKETLDKIRPPAEARDDPRAYLEWAQKGARKLLGASEPEEYEGLDDFQKIAKGNKEMFMAAGTTGPVGNFAGRTYSRLEKAIEALPQNKAFGAHWLGALKAKGGFKSVENEFTGIEEFLKENSGKTLTKDEVLDKVKQQGVKIKETLLGGPESINVLRKQLNQNYDGLNAILHTYNSYETLDKVPQRLKDQAQILRDRIEDLEIRLKEAVPNPKYSGYTEPGGSNYREVLLQLRDTKKERLQEIGNELSKMTSSFDATPEGITKFTKRQNELNQEAKKLLDSGPTNPTFKGPHWDQDNVIAHLRMKDRKTLDGEKILFIEEIQSDWAQKGRRKGFKTGEAETKKIKDKISILEQELDKVFLSSSDGSFIGLSPQLRDKAKNLKRAMADYETQLYNIEIQNEKAVPDTPFKKTEDWLGLAMKRAIDEAVEGGYDGISWTSGAHQFKRYGSELIQWKQNPDGSFNLLGKKQHGPHENLVEKNTTQRRITNANQLEDFLGEILEHPEDAASRANKLWARMDQEAEGVSMPRKEGMEEFYDKTHIPAAIKEYAKKNGIELNIEEGWLPLEDAPGVPLGTIREGQFPMIRIDKDTRSKLAGRAQPLLATAPILGMPRKEEKKEERKSVFDLSNPLDALFEPVKKK